MDCIAHGVAQSWTQLSDFHFDFHLTPNQCNNISPQGALLKSSALSLLENTIEHILKCLEGLTSMSIQNPLMGISFSF